MLRRRFEDDIRRHFAGLVEAVSERAVRIRGYGFIFQPGMSAYRRLPHERVLIFPLGDSGTLFNVLPEGVDPAALDYAVIKGRLMITDKQGFELEINEFGPKS